MPGGGVVVQVLMVVADDHPSVPFQRVPPTSEGLRARRPVDVRRELEQPATDELAGTASGARPC
jgi:hypothetical protein